MRLEEQRFNFIVAKFWSKDSDQLCAYMLQSQVFYGTKKEAENLAKNISEANGGEYRPFYIEIEKCRWTYDSGHEGWGTTCGAYYDSQDFGCSTIRECPNCGRKTECN